MNGKKDVLRSVPNGTSRRTRARGGDDTTGSAKNSAKLSRTDQHRIGDLLQRVYDDVVSEGVPDRFKALLEQLEPPAAVSQSGSVETPTGDQRESLPPTTNLQDKETSG
jgi:hypothetical protein